LNFRIILLSIPFVLASCGAGPPLDYDTAMNLMRDRVDPVKMTFSAAPRFSEGDSRLRAAYQKLLNGRIIQCKNTSALGILC